MESKKQYELSAGEKLAMQNLNMGAVNAKVTLYDLRNQLQEAEAALAAAEKQFQGALLLLAGAHGMPTVQISPDLSTITAQ